MKTPRIRSALLPIVIATSSSVNLESFFFFFGYTLSDFWVTSKPTASIFISMYLIMNCSMAVLVENSLRGICSVLNMKPEFVVGF